MVWCSHCGGDHPQLRDPVTCSVCCSFCSKIHQFDVFTEEPTFVKGSGGESRLAGSFVNSFQSDYSESFKRTIDKGKHKIHELAVALGIEDGSATDLAHAFYKIAVERSFTKGRRTDQVAAACLYIACREALVGENVKVSKTALNIIASMKRDWMQTGRKPSGLCGAAVYISALSHGYTCSKLDIVKAVHVCEATLTKRLIEFEDTNSGSLTIEEFNRNAEVLKNEDQLSTLSQANSQNSDSVEVLCIHKDRKPHFAGLCKDCCEEFIELSGGLHGGAEPPAFQSAERERSAKASSEKVKDPSIVFKPHKKKSSGEHIYDKEVEHFNEANQNATEADTVNFTEPASASASAGDQATVNDAADKFQNSDCTNGVADEPDSLSDIDDDEVKGYLNTEEECYYKKIIWEEMNKEYLQEQAAKEATAASFKDNGGASDEMRSAQELAAATRAAVAKSREERRQKRASEAKKTNAAQTAAEAMRQMLTKKGLSSKINYDVLEKLFDEHPVPDTKRTRVESQHASNVDGQKFSDKRNDAYTNHNDDDEQEQMNGDAEEMGGEEAYRDEWDSRNEEEVSDCGYYYDDGGDD